MAGIWIVGETHELILELLTVGGSLAEEMGRTLSVLLWRDRALGEEYGARGADEILILPELPADEPVEAYLSVIADEAKRLSPDLILFSATARGRDMAARIAARLGTGLCGDCTVIKWDKEEQGFELERLAYGGMAVQKVSMVTRPALATIPPRTFDPASKGKGKAGAIRDLPAPPPSPVKILERKKRERAARDIRDARIVVAAGRGFAKKEDLEMAKSLAEALGGEIACTRPLSEEYHWLPEELCIGLSGVSVKPDLYIGLGVSGQVQHVTGIRDAGIIAAVNKDENAPIFQVADLGIVGDLYRVVPELIDEIRKAKGE